VRQWKKGLRSRAAQVLKRLNRVSWVFEPSAERVPPLILRMITSDGQMLWTNQGAAMTFLVYLPLVKNGTGPVPQPTPTPEPSSVQIIDIYYDGVVPYVESDDYAAIKNTGSSPVSLSGWRLNAGAPGQDFWFPDFMMQPGQECRVHTNEVHREWCGFSFGSPSALWANSGDCGYLYNGAGDDVSTHCY